ncbi:hypothetical protein [Gordonia sp. C13]|uniref:hypothetical protein n=1 Tax=Gordonia sp. C13 TaxID=2935078 RepID=UPI00200A75B1|nr:hypothetical protein [Gordonia sp. C13]MCK8614952.1 hypothetical protein [Gordonia sp. C13]
MFPDVRTTPSGFLIHRWVLVKFLITGWLSVAKPWSRVPGRPRVKAPVPGPRVVPFALIGDIALFAVTGRPIPVCSSVVLLWALVGRRAADRAGTLVS